jgi:hypothetical protein
MKSDNKKFIISIMPLDMPVQSLIFKASRFEMTQIINKFSIYEKRKKDLEINIKGYILSSSNITKKEKENIIKLCKEIIKITEAKNGPK